MLKLSDDIIELAFFISRLILIHLKIIFITSLLISQFLFIVFNCSVISLCWALTLLLQSSFKTILFNFKETLQLAKLFLRFLLSLLHLLFMHASLFLKFDFKFHISLFSPLFRFFHKTILCGFKTLCLVDSSRAYLFGWLQLLPESGVLVQCVL
jgi:hypothetical protein